MNLLRLELGGRVLCDGPARGRANRETRPFLVSERTDLNSIMRKKQLGIKGEESLNCLIL